MEQTVRDVMRARLAARRDPLISLLRDLVAIPSYDGDIRAAAARVETELPRLGFRAVHYAPYGDLVARIGDGPRMLLYDSHLDTVGVGDPGEWPHPPFGAEIHDGAMHGRGTADEKGSTPPMLYGLALAHELGWLEGWTVYYFGSIEEWCEGLSARVWMETEGPAPDFVVIGEPTNLRVYRGQKGRVEIQVTARGRGAHGAQPWLGDNAVYKMQEVVRAIPALDARLPRDPLLGRGSVVVTHIESREGSFNAVPDRCSIVLDRRLVPGETKEAALAEVQALVPSPADFQVEVLRYDRPSYAGYRREVEQFFPAWAMAEDQPIVRAAVATAEAVGLDTATGHWNFSTNGAYWAGAAGIPSVGFGPGEEDLVHTTREHVRLDDVMRAAEWYALFPVFLKQFIRPGGDPSPS